MNFILIKFGGNAMISDKIKQNFCYQIKSLKDSNYKIIIVHGGGPFIQSILDEVGLESKFINGHRFTGEKSLKYIEMALSGEVNGDLVRSLNNEDCCAVGLSGKDAKFVKSIIRKDMLDGVEVNLGRVGDVIQVDNKLINTLLDNGFTPVISPIATAIDGKDLNINADMFAGHLAGSLGVDSYVVLTDVDGLYSNFKDKGSLIRNINIRELDKYNDAIVGGMIPKIDSIKIALKKGAKSAQILNGSKENRILDYLNNSSDIGSNFN